MNGGGVGIAPNDGQQTFPKCNTTFSLVYLVQWKHKFEIQKAKITAFDLFLELSIENGGCNRKVQPKANQPNV